MAKVMVVGSWTKADETKTAFRWFHHEVINADSSNAMGLARIRKPDIIFVDVDFYENAMTRMMCAEELCGELRKDPQTAAIPVVVIWEGAGAETKAELKRAGATACLTVFTEAALQWAVLDNVPGG